MCQSASMWCLYGRMLKVFLSNNMSVSATDPPRLVMKLTAEISERGDTDRKQVRQGKNFKHSVGPVLNQPPRFSPPLASF